VKILHFADLHLGVESYGRIDPETGLSTRLQDFLKAFDQLVDYAMENRVDLVLFCGDAYKSREPSQTQQREFARRIKRLSGSGIPVFLLVGNHDTPNTIGGATTPEIFDTLAVNNVHVASKPGLYRIPTGSGTLQIAALPWLRRSTLLTREETKNLTPEQINQRLQQVLTDIIDKYAGELDPALPSILAAHVWVTGASVGSERSMIIGQEPALLLGNVARPAFDYVALGHIHRHQVLSESPPVVYAGSLERVDFGEEADAKGFVVVEIGPDGEAAKRPVSFAFHSVATRRFLTININIETADTNPTATVLKAIAKQETEINDAIVRLQVSLPPQAEGQLNDNQVRQAARDADYFTLTKEVEREMRPRLEDTVAEGLTPLEALKKYLETKGGISAERTKALLEHGEKLIQQHRT
jgi:exonuclease SbcD